ncbi:unnamed protein product [Choristocarpus tenellus]
MVRYNIIHIVPCTAWCLNCGMGSVCCCQGVESSLEKQKRLLGDVKARRDGAIETEKAIVEERRRFLAGAKDLGEACHRHEVLVSRLEQQ